MCIFFLLVDFDELFCLVCDELLIVFVDGFVVFVFFICGCFYCCMFCGIGVMFVMLGKDSYWVKLVDVVVDEIDYLVLDYDVNFLFIIDDLFIFKYFGL